MKQGQVGMTALETVAEDGGNKKASEGGREPAVAAAGGEGGREGGSWKRTELVFTTERTGIKGRKCGAGRQAVQGPPADADVYQGSGVSLSAVATHPRRALSGIGDSLSRLLFPFHQWRGPKCGNAEYFVMRVEYVVI